MNLRSISTCLIPLLLFGLAGCERPGPVTVKQADAVMGTFAEVTAVGDSHEIAKTAAAAGFAQLRIVNRLMSDYREDSEISRLNRLPAGESMIVSHETFACLQAAQAVAEASGGAFDVTCRPFVRAWRDAAEAQQLPTADELAEIRERVGWRKLRLDPERRSVARMVAGLEVDLGAVAKGFALDLAANAMRNAGATGGLVNVGGDVVAFGRRDNGEPWRIGIQHPFKQELFGTLALVDKAVATSGVQQRFFEIGSQRFSHIIDPRTGRPTEQAPSVTVIADDGATADAWATVFSVLTIDEGRTLLAANPLLGLEVRWISGAPEAPTVAQTAGFGGYVAARE